MMQVIYKYPVETVLDFPVGAKTLHAAYQGDDVYVWAVVGTEARTKPAKFVVMGTGWEFEPFKTYEYVGTVHSPEALVWHVFKVPV